MPKEENNGKPFEKALTAGRLREWLRRLLTFYGNSMKLKDTSPKLKLN